MTEILFKYLQKYTTLTEAQQQAIVDELATEEHKKGTILLRQGDVPTVCYFVLKGCVRQYAVDESGREVTSEFYTEEQAIAFFHEYRPDKTSEFSLVCLEDCVLVVGRVDTEQEMYAKHDQLEQMTRKMVESSLGQMRDEFAAFIAATPEERFRSLMRRRPQLIDRVPQHQLASYLGMTPESLSRIKKRLNQANG